MEKLPYSEEKRTEKEAHFESDSPNSQVSSYPTITIVFLGKKNE